jgi:cobalt-zinc-cadmium efflux system membrane fusion protein
MRKNHWIIALLGMTVASFGQQADNDGMPVCDCPSCREKAASGREFTLPGLEGLEEGPQTDGTRNEHTEPAQAHDEHEPGESCCPSDSAATDAPHDHEGGSRHDHADHDEHEDHEPHVGHHHDADVEGHDHGDHDGGEIELSDETIAKLGLQIMEARGAAVARSSTFPAEIKLNRDQTAAVSPRYPSIIRQVFAEIGDAVKKGDVLAALENRETMAVYTVTAPQDGVIIHKDLAVGETASTDKVLFEVTDLSSVWADISIFPQYQHVLKKGIAVTFVAHDGHTAQGVVKYISPIVSHETRTFTARCVLEGADEDFTPGAFVRARIAVRKKAARVVVPRDAVQTIDGESVVFIPGEHGFSAITVKTGLMDDTGIEILQGLEPNDRYVATGAFALKAQMVTSGMDPHAGHGH